MNCYRSTGHVVWVGTRSLVYVRLTCRSLLHTYSGTGSSGTVNLATGAAVRSNTPSSDITSSASPRMGAGSNERALLLARRSRGLAPPLAVDDDTSSLLSAIKLGSAIIGLGSTYLQGTPWGQQLSRRRVRAQCYTVLLPGHTQRWRVLCRGRRASAY